MTDGYYYFKSIKENSPIDKSIGYICITKSTYSNAYFIQCNLDKEKIKSELSSNIIEIYTSPIKYITNGSHLISRLQMSQKNKLFADLRIPDIYFDLKEYAQYILVTNNGKTIFYSQIFTNKSSENTTTSEDIQANPLDIVSKSNSYSIPFDPFNTTNTAYTWEIVQIFNDVFPLTSLSEIAKFYENLNISYDYFSKLKQHNSLLSSDVFLKMTFSSLRISGHLLIGKYTDSNSCKEFNIVGLPGINGVKNIKYNRNSKVALHPLQNYARWMFAINKHSKTLKQNFNGYWLYYFNSENGNPVKPVIMPQ